MNTSQNSQKSHISPSKAAHGRTYDSKLVSREMHRLGNLAHLPAALTPSLAASAASSVTSSLATMPPGGSTSSGSLNSATDPWASLHVHVLPLFNGEPLRIPIEDLNVLVKGHIQTVMSAPHKAIATLEHDVFELIASGMVTLRAKLVDVKDEKLVSRVVETWGFFWDQVLTYVEGVLLPIQTDPLLSSLYRTPKTQRSSSPPLGGPKGPMSSSYSGTIQATSCIDIRSVALCSFRDKVILPFANRLKNCLSGPGRQDIFLEQGSYQQPRLQQMLLVLVSQSKQQPPVFSLTAPIPAPSAGEMAVNTLLRLVRSPNAQAQIYRRKTVQAPSFLSGGQPRDRRGRIGDKAPTLSGRLDVRYDEEEPLASRRQVPQFDVNRERERELLEALRQSPNHIGGWGLGAGQEDGVAEDEEDIALGWDQAQAVVEKMVGMASERKPETRRKMT